MNFKQATAPLSFQYIEYSPEQVFNIFYKFIRTERLKNITWKSKAWIISKSDLTSAFCFPQIKNLSNLYTDDKTAVGRMMVNILLSYFCVGSELSLWMFEENCFTCENCSFLSLSIIINNSNQISHITLIGQLTQVKQTTDL